MRSEAGQNKENCIVRARCFADERCVATPRRRTNETVVCAVCGARAKRQAAKFCFICGHDLREHYEPLAALRASYNLQSPTGKTHSKQSNREPRDLFGENRNGAAQTAIVFAVYSLVPYLGILFCPGALVFAGFGLANSLRKPEIGGKQTAISGLSLGAIVFAVQILLWLLLYIVPELGRNG